MFLSIHICVVYIIYGISSEGRNCQANRPRRGAKGRFMDVARDEDAEDRLMEADDWLWQNLEEQEEEKNETKTSSVC